MVADNLACAKAMIAAYNAQDFALMESQIAADVDFAHFNRTRWFRRSRVHLPFALASNQMI